MIYGILTKSALDDFLALSAGVELATAAVDGEIDLRYQAISNALSAESGLAHEAVHYLWNQVEIAVHLDLATPMQWRLLGIVREALRPVKYCVPLNAKERWTTAINAAASLLERPANRLSTNSRQAVVGAALKHLRSAGYAIEADGNGIRLSQKSQAEICRKLDQLVRRVGGARFITSLFETMKQERRIIDGSLISARKPITVYGAPVAGIPFHFLYSLALKHLGTEGRSNWIKDFKRVEILSRHFASALDVQPHSVFENISIAPGYVEKVLHETVVYDELFSFPQWQPKAVRPLLGEWIDALDQAECDFPHATADIWRTFAFRCLDLSRPDSLTLTSRHHFPGTDPANLLSLTSVPSSGLHKRYAAPSDARERVDGFYPTIGIGEDTFALQPSAIVARGFCERLMSLMRDHRTAGLTAPKQMQDQLANLGNEFGKALEILTAKVLRRMGMNVTIEAKKYRERKGSDPEIDLVVESDDRIFLIECKKKTLTSEARSGGMPALFQDFADSFLHMQSQLARHEAKLRKDGKIVFLDGTVLELRGRQVEKIAVSLFDHGALQDRALLISLFNKLVGHRVSALHPAAHRAMDKINDHLDVIDKSMRQIVDSEPGRDVDRVLHDFAISTWWLSIDQLEYLCGGGKGLWDGLKDIRHATPQSGDIIWDSFRMRHLNKVGRAALASAQKINSRVLL